MKSRRRKHRFHPFRLLISLLVLFFLGVVTFFSGVWIYDAVQETNAKSDASFVKDTKEGQNQADGQYENDPVYQKLQTMCINEPRIKKILKDYEEYPEALLDMLTRNLDMLDFVLAYPEKKGKVYANHVKESTQAGIPLLLQWDERWGYGGFSDGIIATNGCAPTALSMVIVGLRKDSSVTPYVVAKFAEENGYYVNGSGSSWSLISTGSQSFGLLAEELSLSKQEIFASLENGMPIICSMRPGDFTTTGHFIVLTGIKNGKIKVNDPNSVERSEQLWEYATLAKQINNLWSMQVI